MSRRRMMMITCHRGHAPFRLAAVLFISLIGCLHAYAFPEFQAYARKHSGRPVDCGMCHVNPDGPIGSAPGQIGNLNEDDMALLNQARAAMTPGQDVDNPILNRFGNKIVVTIGMTKCLEFQKNPAALAPALDQRSDLDDDGIPDVQEYLAGTDPLDNMSGNPGTLFLTNIARAKSAIITSIIAVFLALYGLRCLLIGYGMRERAERHTEPDVPTLSPAADTSPVVETDGVAHYAPRPNGKVKRPLLSP